jgi:hypothetical protein
MTEKIPYYDHGKWSEIDLPWTDSEFRLLDEGERYDFLDEHGYAIGDMLQVGNSDAYCFQLEAYENSRNGVPPCLVIITVGIRVKFIGAADLPSALALLAKYSPIVSAAALWQVVHSIDFKEVAVNPD